MYLSELPVGSKISDTGAEFPWIVADQAQETYPGTILISDFLAEAGCYDAPEPESRFDDIRQFGWNRYPVSNVHQWLNSKDEDWYHPAHPLDRPPDKCVVEPYLETAGFLYCFSPAFLGAMLPCSVCYAYQDDYYQVRHGTVTARVFLPSRTELGVEDRPNIQEGTPFALARCISADLQAAPTEALVNGHNLCPREFHAQCSYPYWLRSINLDGMSGVYFYGMSRAPYFPACQGSCGIRPVVVLKADTKLLERPDCFGVYHLKGDCL